MDFRDLISTNSSSTMSSNSRIAYTGPEQSLIINLLANALGLQVNQFVNPYVNEEDEKEAESYIENIELIKWYYRDVTSNTYEPDEKYLKTINHLWYTSTRGDFPSLDNIVENLYENRCECTYAYDTQIVKNLLRHFFIIGLKDSCNTVRIAMEFYVINNSFPSIEEIENTAERMDDFYNDPEAFHQEDKVLVGVKGLEQLKVHTMDTSEYKSHDDLACSICQEDIIQGQRYIRLDCRHIYHFHNKDCLEEGSIINWLEKNKFCPNCKCEVVVNKE
jgi:hypothetical protein